MKNNLSIIQIFKNKLRLSGDEEINKKKVLIHSFKDSNSFKSYNLITARTFYSLTNK
jgi:hypothetical protein